MSDSQIKIEYLLNSSEFNKNMASMKKNMQLCNEEVKNSAKEMNTYGSNIQTLTSRQKAIQQAMEQSKKIMAEYNSNLEKNKKALEGNKQSLEDLSKAKKQANNEYKNAVKMYGEESEEALKLKEALDEVSDEYANMKSRVKGNEDTIVSNTAQLEKQRGVLIDLEGQLKATNKALEEQSNKFILASKRFSEWGQNLEKIGGSLKNLGEDVQRAGAIIVTASAGLATLAMSAESGFAKVNTLAKDSGESLKNFKKDVYDLSDNTGQSVEDLTDALYNAISAGVDYSQSVEFMEQVNKVATGGFGEIADASSALTSIMNIYGKTVKDTGEISDKLFVAQEKGVLTVGELSSVLGESASSAKAYNVDLDNLLSGYVSLTKAGINVNQSNTKLRAMFEELGDTGSNVGKILEEKTGKSFTQLMEDGNSLADVLSIITDSVNGSKDDFNALWSSSEAAGAGFVIASEGGKVFKDALKGMGESAGKCNDAFEEVANTSEFKFKKSINEVKNSASKLGESLLPVLDELSKGISNVAKYISKLNPETVVAVAKFGALALVFGTAMKATGSLVEGLGKGAQALSGLFKIAADTKSFGSFSKALAESDTAIGGLVKSAGGLSEVFGGFTLTGGLIGGAIAGVAALGYAFYENQKSCEEGEAALAALGDGYGDFTGRVRTESSEWSKIFGTEYTLKFSDQYKDALANSEQEVAGWVDTLKGYQQNIYDILNNTEIDQGTKEDEIKQLIKNSLPQVDLEGNVNSMKEYLRSMNWDESDINKYVEAYKEQMSQGMEQINGIEEKGLELLKKYTTTTTDEMGNIITNVDFDSFSEEWQAELDKNSEVIINMTSTTSKDMVEQAEKGLIEQQRVYGDTIKGTLEARYKELDEIQRINKAKLEDDLKYAKENHASQATIDNINKQIFELDRLEQVQKDSLLRRAMYDSDYAQSNKIAVDQINEGMWQVQDTVNGTNTIFFDNEQRMTEWANTVGYSTQSVTDAFGNTHQVVVDAGGGIVAMLDEGASTFGYFGNEATAAMQKVIDQAGVTEGTADQKFAAICGAIDDGTLSAQQFGLTDQEFYQVARAMAESSGDAQTLTGKLKNIPKETTARVETQIRGESNLDSFIGKLSSFAGKVFTATVNVATQGIDAISGILGKKETGGTIQKSGIYNINEAGTELVDSFGASTTSNYSLASAVRGEYAYLEQGTKVTNALMTTQKMNDMVNTRVDQRFLNIDKRLDRLCTVLERAGINTGSNINVTMNNPNFTDQNSQKKKLNEMVTLIKGVKR